MTTIHTLKPVRTNNFIDLGEKIIAKWNELLSLNLKDEIKYCCYYNYDSNYKGNYDFAIGIEKEFLGSSPLSIPKLNFKVFSCPQEKTFETWQEIWALEENNQIKRAYKFDYEKHFPNGNTEIYIGIVE